MTDSREFGDILTDALKLMSEMFDDVHSTLNNVIAWNLILTLVVLVIVFYLICKSKEAAE